MNSDTKDYKAFFYTDTIVKKDTTLKDISKLIFSDIAYFQFLREGKCTASNPHFAKKYGKSNGTISKAISELENKGYIERYLDPHKNRTIYVRRSKFALDQPNEEISDMNSPPNTSLNNEEDNKLLESNPSSSVSSSDGKYIKLSKTDMEDLINTSFSNE